MLWFVCILLSAATVAADTELEGSWKNSTTTADGEAVTQILLFTDKYFSWTAYMTDSGAFLYTKGGSWKEDGKQINLTYEFHTEDKMMVGQVERVVIAQKDGSMTLSKPGGDNSQWTQLDKGVSTDLTSAWLMAGRKQEGEVARRNTNVPRKTMKILTGNRFQWIAYNTETGEFFGTGGGTYEAKDGKYVEKLEFFSRDNSRVGKELSFDFKVEDAEWHHIGFSSAGEPMYEVWAKRE